MPFKNHGPLDSWVNGGLSRDSIQLLNTSRLSDHWSYLLSKRPLYGRMSIEKIFGDDSLLLEFKYEVS
jgi:hypothetical protein